MNWNICFTSGVVIGAVLIILGPILGYVIFPPVVRQTIIDSITLNNNTEQFERWERLPQPLDFKVYIFNVTNPDEIQRGGKPIVKEVGPYVYSQYRQKYNIRFSRDKETLSYYQKQIYKFNSEASSPFKEDDKIIALSMHMNSILQVISSQLMGGMKNVRQSINSTLDRIPVVNVLKRFIERVTPVQSIFQMVEEETALLLRPINDDLQNIFGRDVDSFFVTTTPRQFLFDGIEFCEPNKGPMADIICAEIRKRGVKTLRETSRGSLKFSFFHFKNNSHDGLYEINTGKEHILRLLDIESWNSRPVMRMWNDNKDGTKSTCNMINGTDASQAPPFRQEGDDFFIFSSDICRSVQLFYDGKAEYKGIPGFRYKTRRNFLNEIGVQYKTECYCINRIYDGIVRPDGCLYEGALDLTTCLGAPIVVTLPHMMDTDEIYSKKIDGLRPDPAKHQIFLEVEPLTGTPLRGGKKVQFNMFLRKIQHIDISQDLRKTLFPVIWVDEGIELNDEMVNMLKDQLINILLILEIVQWGLVALGVVIVIAMITWYFCRRKRLNSSSIEPIYTVKG